MENFFKHTTSILGFILDLGGHERMRLTKNAIINFARTLEGVTEDKLYTYRPGVVHLEKWMGESVAVVANYAEKERIDPESAITETISALSITGDFNEKTIFYITDRTTPSRHRRVQRGMKFDSVNDVGCRFVLVDLANKPDTLLQSIAETNSNCTYIRPDTISLQFIKDHYVEDNFEESEHVGGGSECSSDRQSEEGCWTSHQMDPFDK